jgi:nanoRNase/pAp phosphatase (c-di-AMP/oligoRNAs hydrolase)
MSDEQKKYRLVTRSDFDGLVCAVLLKELDLIDDIKFVHPKDMQDGTILITGGDITTNLPYVEGVHLAFDHHLSETIRVGEKDNHIISPEAPSAARVVYDYYGGKEAFGNVSDDMMEAVDKGDSAQFSREEVLNPDGWVLMNYLMDSRTGLGRFREFRVSNYQLMMHLIDYCREHDISDILKLPDVKERVDLYREHEDRFKEQIQRCATVHGNLVILDLRNEETIYAGNRFMVYALYPDCNISIHCMWGLNKLNTVFATGKSILNRTSNTNIGELMLKYGGGGHENAGTCQVENDEAEKVLGELIEQINADG